MTQEEEIMSEQHDATGQILEQVPLSPNGSHPSASRPQREAPPIRSRARRILLLGLIALGLVASLIVGVPYVRSAMTHESTDNAFIDGHVVAISPKVASNVLRVHINDNSQVKAGDLLVQLDPRDFEARLAQAQANLAAGVAQHQGATINVRVVGTTAGAGVQQAEAAVQTAHRQVDGARSRLEEARAQVAAADAEAVRARADAQRYERLAKDGFVSLQDRDNAVAKDRTAAANLDAARRAEQAAAASVRQSEAQLQEAQARLASAKAAPDQVAYSRAQAEQAAAQIEQLKAAVRQAELDLSYTKIYAPEAGRITRKSVEPGAYVQVGQTIFSLVPDHVWVIANFKETQLRYMRPGQPVTIKVDAYPDRQFRGHVDSIQAGAGARFSLLPPENATGNYVKVVQRVPVKILLDEAPDPAHLLGPGMSVVPEVKVR
jgi:membrane fusion protein (multidrug efflux system)